MEAIVSPLRSFFLRLFKRWEKNPKDQQYFLKMFFAIISALVCGFAGTSFAGLRGVMFGFLMYAASLFVIVYLLDIAPEAIGGRQKLVTDTLFSFLMLWILLWTLIYTMIYPLAFGTLPIPINSTLSG